MSDELLEAVARGWCHTRNAKKEMDLDLALAIAQEVRPLIIQLNKEIERLTRERDEAIAELNNSGLGSALHFAAAAMVERDGLKAENERLRTALDMAPHANGTICAIYDIDWDIETDPPVDAGEPCNCWKREIDAPGGE